MKTEDHLAKARRILSSIGKLDASEDAIAVIDATMIAGYHLGNALLHAAGASDPDTHWNTPSKLELPVSELPPEARSAFGAFADLEALRLRYVRNPAVPDQHVARDAQRKLRAMAEHCGL